eukprot:scaffold570072_cov19-Prasinocladus_malaysianus.AAC.2
MCTPLGIEALLITCGVDISVKYLHLVFVALWRPPECIARSDIERVVFIWRASDSSCDDEPCPPSRHSVSLGVCSLDSSQSSKKMSWARRNIGDEDFSVRMLNR